MKSFKQAALDKSFKISLVPDEPSNCCTPKPNTKAICSNCKEKAKGVLPKTLKALLKNKTILELSSLDGFFYCKTSNCDTIYFKDNIVLFQKDVKVIVGLKEYADPATLCYCFDWSKQKIKDEIMKTGSTIALDDIKAKMKNPGCSCEILNPSGGCCLSDVGKAIKDLKKELF